MTGSIIMILYKCMKKGRGKIQLALFSYEVSEGNKTRYIVGGRNSGASGKRVGDSSRRRGAPFGTTKRHSGRSRKTILPGN